MIENIKKDTNDRMQKSIDALKNELSKLRTGRAHPSLLEHIMVNYYGNLTPLNQVSTISIADARTLMITPWEKSIMQDIDKAILASDLGLNPINLGNAVKVPMPPLTEARRRELIKVVKNEAENSKISARNIRRDANAALKDLLKDKTITEDQERKSVEQIQNITNDFTKKIDEIVKEKEQELLAI